MFLFLDFFFLPEKGSEGFPLSMHRVLGETTQLFPILVIAVNGKTNSSE